MPALLRSFGYAFEGLGHLVRTQRSFRIELVLGAFVVVAGTWLRVIIRRVGRHRPRPGPRKA
ncbi:MAG: diacylglycerol kinase family protein [Chloroflexota bacterium]|nr:diacylglycerol kinase family protein [Chloroflexota bacterium]